MIMPIDTRVSLEKYTPITWKYFSPNKHMRGSRGGQGPPDKSQKYRDTPREEMGPIASRGKSPRPYVKYVL